MDRVDLEYCKNSFAVNYGKAVGGSVMQDYFVRASAKVQSSFEEMENIFLLNKH